MKTKLLLVAILAALSISARAQSEAPVITELHQLLQKAKNNFANQMGKVLEVDTANNNTFYAPLAPAVAADAFIMHLSAGQNLYILNYDATGDKIAALIPIVDQYMNELNKMVKEGDYTGEDYKDKNGKAVTDMRDKGGNLVLRYTSDAKSQTVYLYGFTNTK